MRKHAYLVLSLCLAAAGAARADSGAPAICAVEQTIACTPFEECQRNLPGAVNLPVLMRVDPAAGVIVSRTETGEERRSEIAATTESGDDILLNGIDEGNLWSLRVSTLTGRFTLAVLQGEESILAYGVCSRSLLQ
jgi:hypothetical protein